MPWLLALVGGGMVASMAALAVVRMAGDVTIGQAAWWGFNLVAWMGVALLLAGTEETRIMWIVALSAREVHFTRSRFEERLPWKEIFAAAVFFALLAANWYRTFGWSTAILIAPAAAFGIARVVRRAPFSRWQWTGAVILIIRQALALAMPAGSSTWLAVTAWIEASLWWMVTHRAVKREDDALAVRIGLTRAHDYIANSQFTLAELQARNTLKLATTNEIASAALIVLAASLAGQLRLAEARRAAEGSLELNPASEETRKRLDDFRQLELSSRE